MTSPVTPPEAPSVPPYPALGSPTFNADAYTYGSSMPAVVDGIDALAENAFTNATSANESAVASASSAAAAALSAQNAAGTANFKGTWASLSGALAPPAAVYHEGVTWNLISSVADVTLAEPGVSPAWVPMSTVFPLVYVDTATVTMVSGNEYVFRHPGQITATMPAQVDGAGVVITVVNERTDNVLLRADPGDSFMGEDPDDMTLGVPGRIVARVLDDSWRGF